MSRGFLRHVYRRFTDFTGGQEKGCPERGWTHRKKLRKAENPRAAGRMIISFFCTVREDTIWPGKIGENHCKYIEWSVSCKQGRQKFQCICGRLASSVAQGPPSFLLSLFGWAFCFSVAAVSVCSHWARSCKTLRVEDASSMKWKCKPSIFFSYLPKL